MTIEDIYLLIATAPWFSRLGEPYTAEGVFLQIPDLQPWGAVPVDDVALKRIADQMEWLPSSRDQDDPVHGSSLEQWAERLGKKEKFSKQVLDVYKTALAALRSFEGHPALQVGPNNFTEAARGAALFAVSRAAYEVLLGDPEFWCRMMRSYHSGHWPCGILPDQRVVVL